MSVVERLNAFPTPEKLLEAQPKATLLYGDPFLKGTEDEGVYKFDPAKKWRGNNSSAWQMRARHTKEHTAPGPAPQRTECAIH